MALCRYEKRALVVLNVVAQSRQSIQVFVGSKVHSSNIVFAPLHLRLGLGPAGVVPVAVQKQPSFTLTRTPKKVGKESYRNDIIGTNVAATFPIAYFISVYYYLHIP